VDLRYSDEDERFRTQIRDWLERNLAGEFAAVKGRGGPGDEHALFDERLAWERHLGANGWIGVGWPKEAGGRGLSLHQQVIFYEEYARAQGPGRLGHIGEHLLGPTIIAFGTPEQKERFLPKILSGEEMWCQGYSEPDAGSDLANIATRAELDGDEWVVNGQKVWTSLAHWSDWCFVLARTDRDAPKHKGISYLLVPMRQPGVEIRPIVQISGGSEFNEVFFSDARTAAGNVVGEVNGGWKVAMGTLAFERGASTLGQQLNFQNEFQHIVELARASGRDQDPVIRQRLVDVYTRLRLMRLNAMRMLTESVDVTGPQMTLKLFWATLHRDMGELAMDVMGPNATIVPPGEDELTPLQRLFLFSRSDTIYAGTNQIQRNIIGERALGLPREPSK
jgi:alkylation response protein AidB-like acyl-CoA dehydrogenase